MSQEVRYDVTFFGEDGSDPLWGTATDYVISEASFGTPGWGHPRPYMGIPGNVTPSTVDFIGGSSKLGSMTVEVLDKRLEADDQDTGTVTELLRLLIGSEAIVRRWDDTASEWLTLFRGRVSGYSVSDDLVKYRITIEDPRSFEEDTTLFEDNETFAVWPVPGVVDGWGSLPAREVEGGTISFKMLPQPQPQTATFVRPAAAGNPNPAAGVHYGYFDLGIHAFGGLELTPPVPAEEFHSRLDTLRDLTAADPLGVEVPDGSTAEYQRRDSAFRRATVRWRTGIGDDWNYIRDVPALFGFQHMLVGGRYGGAQPLGAGTNIFTNPYLLFVASFDSDDLPSDDQEVQYQVLSRVTSDQTPYFWDGGTCGDLLYEISQGMHSREVPRETYDTAALTAFRDSTPPARLLVTSPKEARKWVQENIYQASLAAPCLNEDFEIRPVSWVPDDDLSSAPILTDNMLEPIGDFRQDLKDTYNSVEGVLFRDSVGDQETVTRIKAKKVLGIPYGTEEVEVQLNLSPAQRLYTDEIEYRVEDEASVARIGRRPIKFAPETLRAIGDVVDYPVGGDVQDTAAGQQARRFIEASKTRLRNNGTARYRVRANMGFSVVRDLEVGDFVRVVASWLPNANTGTRNAARYMQVFGIAEESPAHRKLYLEDSGIAAPNDRNTFDPDPDGDETTDCIDNGTSANLVFAGQAPDGRKMLALTEDGSIHNDCSSAIELDVLLMGGGGGGGGGNTSPSAASAGGGGGAGGVVEATITINPGETIPVTHGAGGAGGAGTPTRGSNGGDTIIWVDSNGDALDPMTADPADAVRACGGGGGGAGLQSGQGVPASGGSGGGGGAVGSPASSGGNAGGAANCNGDLTQGNAGAGSYGSTGTTNCNTASAGGGGAFGSAGASGASGGGGLGGPGYGGDGVALADWNIVTGYGGGGARVRVEEFEGTCFEQALFNDAGATYNGTGGAYGSGGGGATSGAGQDGTDGLVLLKYKGAAPSLTAPDSTAEENSSDPQSVCITVAEEDWPVAPSPDYRVKIEYAVNDTEPSSGSGLWTFLGYLDEPGTLCTPPLPTGSTVWSRTTAESEFAPPSSPSTPDQTDLTQTPGLVSLALTRDGTEVTATFTPNDYGGGIRVYGDVVSLESADTTASTELAEIDADSSPYTVPLGLARGFAITMLFEVWSRFAEKTGGALLTDDFDRADSADVGDDWTEVEAGSDTASIVSGNLRLSSQSGDVQVYAADIDRDEMFVQVRLSVNSTPTNLAVLSRWDGSDGYVLFVQIDGGSGGGIYSAAAAASQVGTTTGGEMPASTEWVAQIYVTDDLQQAAWGPLADPDQEKAEATDATHNDRPGSAGVILDNSIGTDVATVYEIQIYPDPFVTVEDLPAGWKAKVLDGSDNVVAEATESSGTAVVDLQTYDHGNAYVPTGGYPKLIITDGSDVTQHTETGGIEPGTGWIYSDDGTLSGVAGTQGTSYQVAIERANPTVPNLDDIDGLLDRLTFGDDLTIGVGDDLTPILTDE